MSEALYGPERLFNAKERREIKLFKLCPLCEGHLARVAVRETFRPWHWMPIGYVCETCNRFLVEGHM